MNSMFAEYLNQHAILAVLSNFRRYEINVVRLFMPGRGRIARLPSDCDTPIEIDILHEIQLNYHLATICFVHTPSLVHHSPEGTSTCL